MDFWCFVDRGRRNLKKTSRLYFSFHLKLLKHPHQLKKEQRTLNKVQLVKKPDVILEYNNYMGYVDVADVMLYTYSDERRSVKYWKKVTFHITSKMVVNSYLLNTENDKQTLRPAQKTMSQMRFTQLIVNN